MLLPPTDAVYGGTALLANGPERGRSSAAADESAGRGRLWRADVVEFDVHDVGRGGDDVVNSMDGELKRH